MAVRNLFIDMNAYFAAVEQQDKPALRGRPVAVIPTEAETTSCIAASYEAKKFGVRTGTPVWEARRLCPGIICVVARPQALRHRPQPHRRCRWVRRAHPSGHVDR